MTIELKDGHPIAEAAARKGRSLCTKFSFDELYQQAWVGILSAGKYDEAKATSGIEGYLYKAAFFSVSKYLYQTRTAVSGINHKNYKDAEKTSGYDPENTKDITTVDVGSVNKNQEEEVNAKSVETKVTGFIMRMFNLDVAKAKLYSMLLAGELKSSELAGMLSVDVSKVYATTKQIKNGIENSRKMKEISDEQH